MSGRGHMCAMMVAATMLLVLPTLGCATPSTPPASEEWRVSFDCGHDPGISVVFAGDEARILGAAGPPIVLQRQPTGSGFLYETPTHSLRGDGDELTYTIGRMVPIQCRAMRDSN